MLFSELGFSAESTYQIRVYYRESPTVFYGGSKSFFVVINVKYADNASGRSGAQVKSADGDLVLVPFGSVELNVIEFPESKT